MLLADDGPEFWITIKALKPCIKAGHRGEGKAINVDDPVMSFFKNIVAPFFERQWSFALNIRFRVEIFDTPCAIPSSMLVQMCSCLLDAAIRYFPRN